MAQGYILSEKKTMGQAKIMWLLLADFIGIPTSIYGFILNLDNVKSAVIALLAIIYLMVRIFFYVVQKKQAVREKEFQLWNLDMDKQDRIRRTTLQ